MSKCDKLIHAICWVTILAMPGQSWCGTDLPSEIVRAIAERYPHGEIEHWQKRQSEERTIYMMEIEIEGKHRNIELDEDGSILADSEDSSLPVIGGSLSLGFGVTGEKSIYRGIDDELGLVPALIYSNRRLHLQAYDGINISYDVYRGETFSAGLLGELFTDGFETSDSAYLLGMDEPDMVFAAGLTASYRTKAGVVALKLVNDVTGEHDGLQGELAYACPFAFLGAEITPSVSLTYMSTDVTDYYYGVSSAESRTGRPAYSPDSAVNFSVEVMAVYPLTASIALVGIVNNAWLDSTIEDSPIVDSDTEISATMGLLYTF